MLLEFKNVDTHYGDLHVLKQVNYTIGEGEIVSLLGGNASGKSTTMKTIMGVVRPARGTVIYQGEAIERMPTAERVRRGIAPVLEARRLFLRAAMKVGGAADVAIVLRSGADTEMTSGLNRDETRLIDDAPGVARDTNGPLTSSELFVIINLPKRSTGSDANVPFRGVSQAAISRVGLLADELPLSPADFERLRALTKNPTDK